MQVTELSEEIALEGSPKHGTSEPADTALDVAMVALVIGSILSMYALSAPRRAASIAHARLAWRRVVVHAGADRCVVCGGM